MAKYSNVLNVKSAEQSNGQFGCVIQENDKASDFIDAVFSRLMQNPGQFVAFRSIEFRRAANAMVERGLVETQPVQDGLIKLRWQPTDTYESYKPRYVRGYRLCVPGIEY